MAKVPKNKTETVLRCKGNSSRSCLLFTSLHRCQRMFDCRACWVVPALSAFSQAFPQKKWLNKQAGNKEDKQQENICLYLSNGKPHCPESLLCNPDY